MRERERERERSREGSESGTVRGNPTGTLTSKKELKVRQRDATSQAKDLRERDGGA